MSIFPRETHQSHTTHRRRWRTCQTGNHGKTWWYCQICHVESLLGYCRSIEIEGQQSGVFQEEIPWNSLCQTFRDACFAAHRMGLRYIWIDSLCIIQDSKSDWEIESSLMSTVYGNSTLNLAASMAQDGNMGLFSSRDPQTVKTLRVQLQQYLQVPNVDDSSEIAKNPLDHGDDSGVPPYEFKWFDLSRKEQREECTVNTPLGKRPWVSRHNFREYCSDIVFPLGFLIHAFSLSKYAYLEVSWLTLPFAIGNARAIPGTQDYLFRFSASLGMWKMRWYT